MGIQISGFTDEISSDFSTQLEVASKLGVKYTELRGINGRGIQTYTPEEAVELKRQLDEAGIAVSSIGSPIGKMIIVDDFEPHFEIFKNVVAVAKVLGTRYIRMFSFWVPQEGVEQFEDEVFSRLTRLVEYAKEQDVVLLHENEKHIYGDMAPRCLKLMEKFYGDHFKAVFDFANFVQCGQDTLEAYRMLKPYIAYVHIKDALFEGGQVTPAGWGEGHVKEILADLQASGYDGFLSLEPHLTNFRGFQNLEKAGEAGEKWQLDGYTAFRIAHDALKTLLYDLKWNG